MSNGTSQMVDSTGPDHPHGTKVLYNFAHEIGIQEKQTVSQSAPCCGCSCRRLF